MSSQPRIWRDRIRVKIAAKKSNIRLMESPLQSRCGCGPGQESVNFVVRDTIFYTQRKNLKRSVLSPVLKELDTLGRSIMRKKSTSQSAPARRRLGEAGFFNLRGLLASMFCLVGGSLALPGPGAFSNPFAQTRGIKQTGVGAVLTGWEKQAPYPTRFAANGVDMVTPTEGWAVAYTDILHTTDGGATWENQPRPGFENLYAVDFFDNQHGIAMGNTTLYTRDGGNTWTQVGYYGSGGVEMADANLAFIYDHRVAIYARSTNGGATWTNHTLSSNISSIQCFDSLNCVASSPSGTYHSYDGGLTWTLVPGQGGQFESGYFVSHDWGWYVLNDVARRTTDGGATWQDQTLPAGSWIYDRVFTDENNGWGVGVNMVRTTDGGTTWQEIPLPQEALPLWDVDFLDAQHGMAVGDAFLNTESVIITSSDGGTTWANRTNGSINAVLDLVALDQNHAWAAYDYGGKTSRTPDGGVTWLNTEVGDQYVSLRSIDMADELNGWTVGYHNTYLTGYIYHTTDGGVTWQQQYGLGVDYLQGVAALDAQTAIVIGGQSRSVEHRTTDGGVTWHELNVPLAYFWYGLSFLDDRTGWLVGGNGGNIVKTTDGGSTWVIQNTPAPYTLSSIHFSDPNNGWAGGYYGTLIRTTNGGATWTLQDPQIPEYTHVLDVHSTGPMRGWIAGYGGGAESRPYVKYTTDGGATWIEHTPQVGPYDSFPALAFVSDEYGWAAGAGGIFRHGAPASTPTPTPTATLTPPSTPSPTSTATGTSTPASTSTPTPAPTATLTPTATPVGSPTATPRPTPTARPHSTPRPRATPMPRPR